MEYVADHLELARGFKKDRFIVFLHPATFEFFLIFPASRESCARFRFDVVPPHVVRTFTVSPDVLAGNTAGVTTNALVQMEHHADL